MTYRHLQVVAMLVALLGLSSRQAIAQSNGVLREVWSNIGGATVPDLTNSAAFPDNPTSDEVITGGFEAPLNVGDTYGQRLRALLTPTVTGSYTFYIASDDGSELWLSTDDTPAKRQLIARVATWTDSRVYQESRDGNAAVQKSASISLTNGRSYYLEALMKEEAGGDNLAVTWQRPGDPVPANGAAPIPNSYLKPFGMAPPVVTVQPTNVTVVENGSATFVVQIGRKSGAAYQWIRNGTNIPGAIYSSYALADVKLSDSNSTFRCFISNPYGSTNSLTATLRVLPDTTRPVLSAVVNLGNSELLTVLFSEPVEPASATNAENYTLNNGAQVLSAGLGEDGMTVILTTTPLSTAFTYTLTVNNVRDRAQTPNTILANSQKTLSLLYAPLDVSYIVGTNEPPGPSSRRTGLVISEIMYHPTNRFDGRNLEFIEIYNSNPWPEDLGNHRLSGAVDFTFPPGTMLGAQSYVIVAPKPADLQAVYGIAGVLGPLVNSNSPGNLTNVIDNGGGTIRLRDEIDSVLLEAIYDDEAPYPVSPDGAGHSLVLARPTYGERNPKAWAASDRVGGTPRTSEVPAANPYRTVLINEFLAHTDDPQPDFVELFNYGATSVNLAGCILTDDPATNKFIIPAGTVLGARQFRAFDQSELGFALEAAGETIYLLNPTATKVLDAVRFGDQENGISTGRHPDGAPLFSRLMTPTSGSANDRPLVNGIVINEIMYHPLSEVDDEEFVEIHNRSTNAVDMSKWRLRGGISFTFPNGTLMLPNRYLVLARNLTNLLATHTNLTAANTLGNFSGKLGNGGDTIMLDKPDDVISTNQLGMLVTNRLHIVVDEVTYGTGGRWSPWSDGGGSSLELIDSHSEKRRASAWEDSDETAKSGWTTVEFTGVLDNGAMANADQVHLFLQGAGECLIDNVEVVSGGNNVVANGTFESGTSGWFLQGTHHQSFLETSAGYGSSRSLHVVATGRGDTGANRIRTALTQTLTSGSAATLRCKVKWLKGHPELLLRLHGNYLEAAGGIVTTANFGSPGMPNTKAQANVGPAITDVRHSPVLPAANQAVTVTAQVCDPDGLAALSVRYRVDPSSNYVAVAMNYNGAGFYSAVLPGRVAGTSVAYYIEAQDNFTPRATTRFPDDAPARECIVRWGETVPAGTFGTYRMWVTQRNVTRWAAREKNSNEPLDGTFVYGNFRAVYNMGTYYKGSPWHTPGYSSPDGNACDYKIIFPKDDLLLGIEDMVLATVGNLGSDPTYQGEQTAFWIARKLGAPYMYRRYVRLFFNGQQRQTLYEDSGQPNGDTVSQFYPDDDEGDLHKVEDWFEFDDSGDNKLGNVDATLQPFTTAGGVKKTARYRWTFRPRGGGSGNDFTNLFTLVDALNATQPEPFETQVKAIVDIDGFMRHLAMQRIVGNWDSWGYARGKNDYIYKPRNGGWNILPWDIDFVFYTGGNDPSTQGLFGSNEPALDRFRNWPAFQRAYWRAFEDAVNGPMLPAVMDPMLDGKYAALAANGAGPSDPQGIKDYTALRRTYILSQLATVTATFRVNGASSFSTNRNLITLTGTAPIGAAKITVNGTEYPVTWTTLTAWSMRFALSSGTNSLVIQGWNNKGQPLGGATTTLTINYTGIDERPEDKLVLNEIMYNPVLPDAEYVELLNNSVSNAFDLSLWRIDGIDCVVPPGTIINPGALLVFAKDKILFASTYGAAVPVVAEFTGRLENAGEAIKLVKPGATAAEDQIIDQVAYEAIVPWPAVANGGGYSLQRIDPAQDGRRVANWSGTFQEEGWRMVTTNALMTGTNVFIWLDSVGDVFLDDISLVPATGPLAGVNVLTNSGFESPFEVGWSLLGTNLTNSAISMDQAHAGLASLHVVSTGVGTTTKAIVQRLPTEASNVVNTLTYWYRVGRAGNTLTVRTFPGSTMQTRVNLQATASLPRYTPGTNNYAVRMALPTFPPVWLNEIQPQNVTGPMDLLGHRHPWVELFNSGSNAVSLAGYYLATNYSTTPQWAFPADATLGPGQFLQVWLDGQPQESTNAELHATFTVPSTVGSLALYVTNATTASLTLLDYLNYTVPSAGRSYGDYPDGNAAGRQLFSIITPGATNNPTGASVTVFINEWMADNTLTLTDPADGQFEDWFELYNPADEAVDLSGYFLTDNLANSSQWQIPIGTSIPAGGYLLVWADGEAGQNAPGRDLHASFALARGGEALGLFGPGGALIDAVVFGPQTNDVSQGRFPDGSTSIVFMPTPTPQAANAVAQANFPPRLEPITDKTADEGAMLTFTIAVTDSNYPPQRLSFALGPDAPEGAVIDPTNGIFAWIPTHAQAGQSYTLTVTVADSGTPPLSDTNSFTVSVREVNQAPTLQSIGDRLTYEHLPFTVTASATDPESPPQTFTYTLDSGAPGGMTLDSATGVLSWTPGETQAPDVYFVTVRVTDNGTPPRSDTKGFTLTVQEMNGSPVFVDTREQYVRAGDLLSFLAVGDLDVPRQNLSCEVLPGAPVGLTVDNATGRLSWTPAEAQTPGNYPVTVRVTDDGTPPRSAQFTYHIHVSHGASPMVWLDFSHTGNSLEVRWQATEGKNYQVEYNDDLSQPTWQSWGLPVTAASPMQQVTLPLSSAQRFYRVVQLD